jgi:DNA-binding IclR family transcriptional regulator
VDSVSGVGVLDKAMAVLGALEGRPASLSELVERTGLSRATAHRLAVALEDHGLVRRDDAGRFCLGLRLISLGHEAA